jgi:hypothetical protein
MQGVQALENEKRVLRWGGLAGVLGGVLFILVFVIVGVFVGAAATDPAEALMRFPEIQTARTVENGLYLAVLMLWIASFLAVYRAVRTSLAPALFGSVLGVVGLTLLAAGALPHVATVPVSSLYHAPGVTPDAQATLLLIWRASSGLFDALLFAGLAVLQIGLILLGVAMLGVPAFGRRFGWMTVGLGVIGTVSAVVVLADPGSPVASLGVFGLIAFHLVIGWRTCALSRSGWSLEDQAAGGVPAGGPRIAFESVA